jgi:DNA-binding transcriptional LysR family regulator
MARENLADLQAFVAVAQARSFTRAAAQLGLSRSALSHAMTGLEARLGMRLLTRTTRSVSVTDAGARLLAVLSPRFEDIAAELAQLSALRDKPAGTVRITAHDHAIKTVLWPRLAPLLREYPDIRVELSVDYGLTDIVAERFDAGVRSGDSLNKDMIAVRISPDLRVAIVAAPSYFEGRAAPNSPKDLVHHRCINLRLPTAGGLYAWELQKDGETVEVRVDGQVTVNNTYLKLDAALDGLGLCTLPHDLVEAHLQAGRLVPVLPDWWPTFPGYHLYFPHRRQMSPAFALVLEALRVGESPWIS